MEKPTVWKFKFGEELLDAVSGFKGVVVGRSEFITGCHRYLLQSKCDKKSMSIMPDPLELDGATLQRTSARRTTIKQTKSGPPASKGKHW